MKRIHPFAVVVLASLACALGAQAQETAAVVGIDTGPNAIAVVAEATHPTGTTIALEATVDSPNGTAGQFVNEAGGTVLLGAVGPEPIFTVVFSVDGDGNVAFMGRLNAGLGNSNIDGNLQVEGNLNVVGDITKGGGGFKIDHPMDPANKYLSHSFVESPDRKNVYDGVVELDETGEAWVPLPAWFQALNSDFRYQLTAIGAPMPHLYIAGEISGNRFKIAGGTPSGKVSWQVTGIRQDAYAQAYRIQVEEEKPEVARGTYLHPELYVQPDKKRTELARKQD